MSTTETPSFGAGRALAHDSADAHVCGSAHYVDDLPVPANTLHLAVGMAPQIGRLDALDLAPVHAAEGVVLVLSAADIPAHCDIGPVFPGEPLLVAVGSEIAFHGQALFAVAARTRRQARRAARLALIDIEPRTALQLDGAAAHAAADYVRPLHQMRQGDAA